MARYTQEDLSAALAGVHSGQGKLSASKKWNIPIATLRARLKGRQPRSEAALVREAKRRQQLSTEDVVTRARQQAKEIPSGMITGWPVLQPMQAWNPAPIHDTETPAPNSALPTSRRSSAANRAGTVASSIAGFETGLNQPAPGLERWRAGRKADSTHSPASNNPQQAQHQLRWNPNPPLSSKADMVAKHPYANLDPSAHPQTTSTTFNLNRLDSWQLQGDFLQTSTTPDLQVQYHTWLSTPHPHSTPAASYPILGHVALLDVSPILSDKISDNLRNPSPEGVNFDDILTKPDLEPANNFDPALTLQSDPHLGPALTGNQLRAYFGFDDL